MKLMSEVWADYERWLRDREARAAVTLDFGREPIMRALGPGPAEAGSLIVVGGRPATGKSMFALRTMACLANPALYVSLEDSSREVAKRCACLPSSRLGSILLEADPRARNIDAVSAAASKAADAFLGEPFLLVLDYIQLVRGRGTSYSRTEEIAEILGELQAAGRELNFVTMLNAHLQRPSKAHGSKEVPRPTMSDFGDSKSLEGAANAVILLHPLSRTSVEVFVDKNKHAPAGQVQVYERDPDSGWLNVETKTTQLELAIFDE